MAKTLYLTFDLKKWPWPYTFTTQNVQPRKVHLYTKYQMSISIGSNAMAKKKVDFFYLYIWHLTLKDDINHNKLSLKMCGLSRCICMPNIKSLSVMAQTLWPMLKLSSNKQTDLWQTNKQTGQKQYAPPQILSGGHKKVITKKALDKLIWNEQ